MMIYLLKFRKMISSTEKSLNNLGCQHFSTNVTHGSMEQAWTKSFQNKRQNDVGFIYCIYIYICICIGIGIGTGIGIGIVLYCIVIIVCMCVKINRFYCFFTLQLSKISIEIGAFIHFIDDLSLFIYQLKVVIFHSYVC